MFRTFAILFALCLLSACSSFNLGAMTYCPYQQECASRSGPPAVTAMAPAASAPGLGSTRQTGLTGGQAEGSLK